MTEGWGSGIERGNRAQLEVGSMRHILLLAAIIVAVASPASASKCRFENSPQFQQATVVPEASRVLGAHLTDWDVAHPDIFIEGNTIKLLISLQHAERFLDPPY